MGDASKLGFGSAIWDNSEILWESGHYNVALQKESSNFREADNLVSRIEDLEIKGRLHDSELFTFNDNLIFESCYYKGHSSSEKLTEVILRLRQVQQRTGLILHVVHVAGTRMKEAGVDGLSRGDWLEGLMKSAISPWGFLPLGQSANERSKGGVGRWVYSWWNGRDKRPWCGAPLKCLTPEDWFQLGQVDGPRLWIPPPAAITAVLEMFNEDRMIRPYLPHVFVIPRLMTHVWRKQLTKDADVVFSIPPGLKFWPAEMHEPLVVHIVFPLTHVSSYQGPWLVKGTPDAIGTEDLLTTTFKAWRDARHDPKQLHQLEESVPGLREGPEEWSRSVLLQFLTAKRGFPPVQE
jgi:hypothetical protein